MTSLIDGLFSLSQRINKVESDQEIENSEGGIGKLLPELKVSISDEDLIARKKQWLSEWGNYSATIKERQNTNERYWKGLQHEKAVVLNRNAITDSRIFPDVETLIPLVASASPEPLVSSDDSDEGGQLANKVSKHLAFQADLQNLKLINKMVTRNWMLDLVGAVKFSWDMDEDDIKTVVVRAQKLILDPEGTMDQNGYTGDYIGEFRKERANKIIEEFPNMEDKIKKKVKGKMFTKLEFIEWWTDELVFWTFEDKVMGKINNPHWNYEGEFVDGFELDESGKIILDGEGEPQDKIIELKGSNHFPSSRMPYVFFGGIFSRQEQPHDETSLIEQTIGQQDLINKRQRQIDKNADQTNGGLVLDSNHFNKDQADAASRALRRGGAILAPGGTAAASIVTGAGLPNYIFATLADYRSEIDNIFGIHSATRGEQASGERTVGGKILLKESDKSRASTITEYLEQFDDNVFNWWLQMMYVYYDESHTAKILGEEKKNEFIDLINDELLGDILIGVKEGSMIPKDPLTRRNEAIDLWGSNAIDPISLFERLDDPDPRAQAEKLFKWTNNPASLFGEASAEAGIPQVPGQEGGIPPEGAPPVPPVQ